MSRDAEERNLQITGEAARVDQAVIAVGGEERKLAEPPLVGGAS